jgi:hypothetical protein
MSIYDLRRSAQHKSRIRGWNSGDGCLVFRPSQEIDIRKSNNVFNLPLPAARNFRLHDYVIHCGIVREVSSMFCNQCGTPLQPNYNLCPKCGQAVGAVLSPVAKTNRLQDHLRTLGILWIIAGCLFLVPALAAMIFGTAASMFIPFHDAVARTVGPFVIFMVGSTLLILGAGGVSVGWGLMQRRSWARIVAIVLGALALFHPPIGTALGIYTLWVLLSNDAENQYQQLTRPA